MGHRLSKLYTRTGDRGTTGLGDGSRVDKNNPRIEAYGDVDELNSLVGMVLSHTVPEAVAACLIEVQHDLFNLGGELCMPGHEETLLTADDVNRIEAHIDHFNAELPPLKEFILPGGGPAAASCHLARTVCRRAERRVISLAAEARVPEQGLIYLNRLSDLLFVVARTLARHYGAGEVLWQRGRDHNASA